MNLAMKFMYNKSMHKHYLYQLQMYVYKLSTIMRGADDMNKI